MAGRKGLEATDEIERRLLMEIDAIEDGRARAAVEALGAPTRDVVDDMWSTRGGRARRAMRLSEATKIAIWLGYKLTLEKLATPARSRARPAKRRTA